MLIHFYRFIDNLKSTPARKNKLIIAATAVGLVFNLLAWLLIYWKLLPAAGSLPVDQAYIPLHYNIYIGVDSYGAWQRVFLLPGIGLAFIVVNTVSAFSVFNKKEIASHILCLSAAFAQILLFISAVFITLINI